MCISTYLLYGTAFFADSGSRQKPNLYCMLFGWSLGRSGVARRLFLGWARQWNCGGACFNLSGVARSLWVRLG